MEYRRFSNRLISEPYEGGEVYVLKADADVLLANRAVVSDRRPEALNDEALDTVTLLEPLAVPQQESDSAVFLPVDLPEGQRLHFLYWTVCRTGLRLAFRDSSRIVT
jgi:hypothetical protein